MKAAKLVLFRNWQYTLLGGIVLTIVLWSAVKVPGMALTASFTPSNPRLGETLVVNITPSPGQTTAPTIKVGGKTYPAFNIGANRFRAMIPTT
ncbi:MAG: hypothetical protein LH474_13655, partial [Chamaesiphon sp.]|nr:hypothetical protein [Chamaesiphon sp.]